MGFIEDLHRLASELLEHAEVLDAHLKSAKDLTKSAKQIQQLLDQICTALGRVLQLLNDPDSPLRQLAFNAGSSLQGSTEPLRRFLEEHRAFLERLRIPAESIEKVLGALEEEIKKGTHKLENGETLEAGPVLDTIREFQDLVCAIAGSELLAQALAAPEILKAIVTGVIGTALVIVDVTGAISAGPHDPSGWVLVKAIKSVWAGVSKVRKAIKALREEWNAIQARELARKRQAELRKRGQPPLKPKPKPKG